jgi:hypothetical protein
MKALQRVAAASFTLLSVAVLVSPADAATYHWNYPSTCTVIEDPDLTLCYGSTGQYNWVQRSGVYIYNGQGTATYTVSSADYYDITSEAIKFTNVISRTNVVSRQRHSIAFPYNGLTCHAEQILIFANGQIRLSDSTVKCT